MESTSADRRSADAGERTSADQGSADAASRELLRVCLAGERWTDAQVEAALAERDGRALLQIVVERLADLFEPKLCDTYARLFAEVLNRLSPEHDPAAIVERYERVRRPRVCASEPRTIYVLSRVTLGADVAVTSVVLDALKRRFPASQLVFVGSRKNFELFEADDRIEHFRFEYARNGGLAERVAQRPRFTDATAIVVDPDSRLTQLGLLPPCEEENYYFFESRAYGGDSDATLRDLTARWVAEVFGESEARAYVAPRKAVSDAEITVSLGVGENPEKRINDEFELGLIRLLAETGARVVIDEGSGGEERARVQAICREAPNVASRHGSYGPFASMIAQSKLYAGYDSAGQHVAAACGVPLISIFAGYASDRMYQRWRPSGPGRAGVIKVEDKSAPGLLGLVEGAIQYLTL